MTRIPNLVQPAAYGTPIIWVRSDTLVDTPNGLHLNSWNNIVNPATGFNLLKGRYPILTSTGRSKYPAVFFRNGGFNFTGVTHSIADGLTFYAAVSNGVYSVASFTAAQSMILGIGASNTGATSINMALDTSNTYGMRRKPASSYLTFNTALTSTSNITTFVVTVSAAGAENIYSGSSYAAYNTNSAALTTTSANVVLGSNTDSLSYYSHVCFYEFGLLSTVLSSGDAQHLASVLENQYSAYQA